jgi:hypothetical protein
MTKSILLSVQPKFACKILNGEKTLEIRKTIPKGFVGWVNMYVTKGKPGLGYEVTEFLSHWVLVDDKDNLEFDSLNGKVVARFWFDEYDVIVNGGNCFYAKDKDEAYTNALAKQSCLTFSDLKGYSKTKTLYAWHIKRLEIFDKPKESGEFYTYKGKMIYSDMDCPPYWDDVIVNVTKAPQSWQFVWEKEQKAMTAEEVLKLIDGENEKLRNAEIGDGTGEIEIVRIVEVRKEKESEEKK